MNKYSKINGALNNIDLYYERGFIEKTEYKTAVRNIAECKLSNGALSLNAGNDFFLEVIEHFINNFTEIDDCYFFDNFAEKTRKQILKYINEVTKWSESKNWPENSSKLHESFFKKTIEKNSRLITQKLNLELFANASEIVLDGEYLYEFIINNINLNYVNHIPRDLSTENSFNLLRQLAKLDKTILNIEKVLSTGLNTFKNKNLQNIKFKNSENLYPLIIGNGDFNKLDEYPGEIIYGLYEKEDGKNYINKNFENIYYLSPKLFITEIKIDDHHVPFRNLDGITAKYISYVAKENNVSFCSVLYNDMDNYMKSKDGHAIMKKINSEIIEKTNIDKATLIKVIKSFDDFNILRMSYNEIYGYEADLSFEEQKFWPSTPLSVISEGNCIIKDIKDIKLSKSEFLNKIKFEEREVFEALLNSAINTKKYSSIQVMLEWANFDNAAFLPIVKHATNVDINIEREKNNQKTLKVIQKLNHKDFMTENQLPMPPYRRVMFDAMNTKFEDLIKITTARFGTYGMQNYNELTEMNASYLESFNSMSPYIKMWAPNIQLNTEMHIDVINEANEKARDNESEAKKMKEQYNTNKKKMDTYGIATSTNFYWPAENNVYSFELAESNLRNLNEIKKELKSNETTIENIENQAKLEVKLLMMWFKNDNGRWINNKEYKSSENYSTNISNLKEMKLEKVKILNSWKKEIKSIATEKQYQIDAQEMNGINDFKSYKKLKQKIEGYKKPKIRKQVDNN